ncbi:hypothetical protein NLG97_g7622 [Lecanicillium saksenae]|uniref:Uncharacterized protein n=1 Tax=Lecanicillium saksenae TaxID=468837 RepID=A0ACC1QLC4_9HYPO|nr:hypothetical protein NLG97_g7622 [Lecanicillium saksenae]
MEQDNLMSSKSRHGEESPVFGPGSLPTTSVVDKDEEPMGILRWKKTVMGLRLYASLQRVGAEPRPGRSWWIMFSPEVMRAALPPIWRRPRSSRSATQFPQFFHAFPVISFQLIHTLASLLRDLSPADSSNVSSTQRNYSDDELKSQAAGGCAGNFSSPPPCSLLRKIETIHCAEATRVQCPYQGPTRPMRSSHSRRRSRLPHSLLAAGSIGPASSARGARSNATAAILVAAACITEPQRPVSIASDPGEMRAHEDVLLRLKKHEDVLERLFPGYDISQLEAKSRPELLDELGTRGLAIHTQPLQARPSNHSLQTNKDASYHGEDDSAPLSENGDPAPEPQWDESLDQRETVATDDINAIGLATDKQARSYLGISSMSAAFRAIFRLYPPTKDHTAARARACAAAPPPNQLAVPTLTRDPALSLLREQRCIDFYFDHFHAVTPLIDEEDFRKQYATGGRRDGSWLGLLNMVFALGSIASGSESLHEEIRQSIQLTGPMSAWRLLPSLPQLAQHGVRHPWRCSPRRHRSRTAP